MPVKYCKLQYLTGITLFMGYPNILDDVLYLNSTVPSLVTRTLNIESLTNKHDALLKGTDYFTSTLKFNKNSTVLLIKNPDVDSNSSLITTITGNYSNSGIVAQSSSGAVTGQVILGRQYSTASNSTVLGNCILEHFNGNNWSSITVGHKTDGTKFATINADTPSKTDKSSNIATTNWVKTCIPLNLHAYGYWDKTKLLKSYNCSMGETSPGLFQITFHSPTPDTYYMVAVSGEYGGAGEELFGVYGNTTTKFNIDVRDHTGTAPAVSQGIIRFFVWA